MLEFIKQPWPWYVAGALIGLTVPALLILGNKPFGVSSSLRHICAACFPSGLSYFKYNWKNETWNLFFVTGIFLGALMTTLFLQNPNALVVSEITQGILEANGVKDFEHVLPEDIFNWQALLTVRGIMFIVLGGFLVGFGTRYAGGCTSGHAIMGLSDLQWPSLIATISFMTGGILVSWFIVPLILNL